jgi:hypothetical protein
METVTSKVEEAGDSRRRGDEGDSTDKSQKLNDGLCAAGNLVARPSSSTVALNLYLNPKD